MMSGVLAAIRSAIEYGVWIFSIAVALTGAALVIERGVFDIFSVSLVLLGPTLEQLATYIPTFSLLVICISIYFEHLPRTNPTPIAKSVVSPLFIALAVGLLGVQIFLGHLDPKYIEGVSFLALGGALLRVRGAPIHLFRREGSGPSRD